MSEETARRIDEEIQRIITEQYERAKKIISEHRPALDKIAEALLEHETLEGRHVLEILEYGEIRSPIADLGDRKAAGQARGKEGRPTSSPAPESLGGRPAAPTPA